MGLDRTARGALPRLARAERRAAACAVVLLAALCAAPAAATPRICISSDTLLFGNRTVGTGTTLRSTVRSCGGDPFSFTGVSVHPATGPDYHVATDCVTGQTLAPGGACNIDVTFAPLVAGQTSGAVWLHNTTSTPDQLVTFYGRGVDARSGTATIEFAPAVASFGSRVVGQSGPPLVVDLRNAGSATFVPSALVLNGPAAYDYSAVSTGDPTDCLVGRGVAPGTSCRMNLYFQPAQAGTRAANLVIDAPELPGLAILSIIGQGAAAAPPAALVTVVEYHHAPTRQYFLTPDPAEQAFLDAGGLGGAWLRTGFAFRAFDRNDATDSRELAVCRFFGTPGVGPNSHFYTADPAECAAVRANPLWQDEGIAFHALLPAAGVCPAGYPAVVRLWQAGTDPTGSRHRYLVDAAEIARMAAAGWVVEGPVFCAPGT